MAAWLPVASDFPSVEGEVGSILTSACSQLDGLMHGGCWSSSSSLVNQHDLPRWISTIGLKRGQMGQLIPDWIGTVHNLCDD
jgi:hypothetical protein